MKKLIILFFLFSLSFASPVKAANEFNTDYQINYLVDSRGQVIAEQEITLTNNMANIYPKEYLIETSQKVSNISAWDEQGNILKKVDQGAERTKIKLSFNEESVGKGEKLGFTIKYSLEKLALRKGRVWEISLPQLGNHEQIDSLGVRITVPDSFGKLAYSSVKIDRTEFLGNKTRFILNPKKAHEASILSFGDFQSFDFSLRYQLENPDAKTWEFLVAIPPLTNYQEIVLTDLRPLPEKIKLDQNGNWLAVYYVEPRQILPVLVEGQAKVFAIPQSLPAYNQTISLDLFLKEQDYWPISDPKITKLASELKTPKKIYNYVVNNLSYNYQALNSEEITRQGALSALENPQQAVCSEFTDLFVTLARAANIPAREIEGFAYTNNPQLKPLSLKKDVLHAWPEYWDKEQKQWIQVDPTWEKTTGGVDYFEHFDFNHLTFVIHGSESNFPPPPGTYFSSQPIEGKNISVDFATQEVAPPSDQELLDKVEIEYLRGSEKKEAESTFTQKNLGFFKANNQGRLLIKNNNLHPIKNATVNQDTIALLPPWARETIEIETPPLWQQLLVNPKIQASLKLENYPEEKTFELNLLSPEEAVIRQTMIIGMIILGSVFLVFLIVKIVKKVAKRK